MRQLRTNVVLLGSYLLFIQVVDDTERAVLVHDCQMSVVWRERICVDPLVREFPDGHWVDLLVLGMDRLLDLHALRKLDPGLAINFR